MNAIWQVDYSRVFAQTHVERLKGRLLRLNGTRLSSVFFKGERRIGWVVEVPADRTRKAEQILGVKCDRSTSCTEVRPPEDDCSSVPILGRIRQQNPTAARERLGGAVLDAVPLPEELRDAGLCYRVVERSGPWVLLMASEPSDTARAVGWEVLTPQLRRRGGRFVEKMPPSEQWGYSAWSFSSEEQAREVFESLTHEARSEAV